MTKSAKPTLLDELRKQSEERRAQDTAARLPMEAALQEMDRGLWRAFRWLDEAMGHLEVIRPTVTHKFQLGNILTLDRPRFDRGFVSFRRGSFAGYEVLTYLELFYSVTGTQPFILRVTPGAAAGIEERLRGATMQFDYQTEQDEKKIVRYGLFHVKPAIAASVRFQPDYARQVVDVTLRNVDRFESVLLEFQPGKLDESALEDLIRFMLGEDSGFLRRAPLALIKPREDEPQVAQGAPASEAT
jgi:hypothetical protein